MTTIIHKVKRLINENYCSMFRICIYNTYFELIRAIISNTMFNNLFCRKFFNHNVGLKNHDYVIEKIDSKCERIILEVV
jgi:hypothetical protein